MFSYAQRVVSKSYEVIVRFKSRMTASFFLTVFQVAADIANPILFAMAFDELNREDGVVSNEFGMDKALVQMGEYALLWTASQVIPHIRDIILIPVDSMTIYNKKYGYNKKIMEENHPPYILFKGWKY